MSYLDELSCELRAVGINGSRRRRILAEAADHLEQSGDAAAFGTPRLVAQRFADELATSGARRAAYGSFLALVPAALVYAPLVLLGRSPDVTSASTFAVGLSSAFVLLLAPQVALAAATLAVLRAWRLRDAARAPAAELRILGRRTLVALGCGLLTLTALVVYAYEYQAGLSRTWMVAAVCAATAAAVPLVVAARAAYRPTRLRAATAGGRGDLRADVEPIVRFIPAALGTPWRLCFGFASLVAVAALVGGRSEGPRNAIAEFVAIVSCFAALGRPLGLLPARDARRPPA